MSELVEFRHLKYIAAVAETGNFTRAAERLFLSQPSLSKQIKDIEAQLGIKIFNRTPDGVFPTPVGKMVVDYAIATLHGRSHVFKIAKEIFLGKIPPLRVGFSPFVNSRHLQAFRASYSKHFPECALQLSGGGTVHVLQRIERGDLDCALLILPVIGPNWSIRHIASSPLVACMRSDDQLAEKSLISLDELSKRLTIFRDPDGHPSAHSRLMQLFAEAGYSIHISCSAATPQDIQLLVRDGFGIALATEDSTLESDVTTRRIGGIEWTADTAFVHLRGAEHPALLFIDKYLLSEDSLPPRIPVKPNRPQLSLKFEISA